MGILFSACRLLLVSAVLFFVGGMAAHAAPSVSFVSPTSGSTYLAPATIGIKVKAISRDDGARIKSVKVLAGNTALTATSTDGLNWTTTWSNVPAGSYSIVATAYDNLGASRSASVSVTVTSATNQAPTVSLTAPASGSSFIIGDAVSLAANASDTDGSIASVKFYAGSTLIGTDTTAPYALAWNTAGLAAGTYSLTAVATDNGGKATTSAARSVTLAANQLPNVSITSPTAGANFTTPATINIAASASDPDGAITEVRFYGGGTLLATDTSAPYAATWSGPPVGTHTLQAIAKDNRGGTRSTSISVQVGVTGTISLNPNPCTLYESGQTECTTTVSWSTPDPSAVVIESYLESNGSDIIAHENQIGSGTSGSVASKVRSTQQQHKYRLKIGTSLVAQATPFQQWAPNTWITAPANNHVVNASGSVTIAANATDSDGTIQKVEFYRGSTLLGTDTTSPYSFTWTNIPAGTYSLTSRAYDNHGAQRTSAPVTLIANAAPSVALSSPASGASFQAGSAVGLAANASDPDGSVASVKFYAGGTLVGTDTAAPYAVTWNTSGVAPGTYAITAVATDNRGRSTTSAARSLTVTANQPPNVSITAPVSGARFTAPATIHMAAAADDPDGSIAAVRFYGGGSLLATDTSAPYTATWSGVPAGSHTLQVVAVDNNGATRTATALVDVDPLTGSISLDPNPCTLYVAGQSECQTTVSWSTSDPSAIVVESYLESNGADVIAHENQIGSGASGSVASVVRNTQQQHKYRLKVGTTVLAVAQPFQQWAPTTSITAPANNDVVHAPGSVTITANATDSDGTIQKVEFYRGSTLLGTDTTSPYSFAWTNIPAGTYSLTSRAYDNHGAQRTSAPVTLIVNALPSVTLTAPADDTVATAPASVTVSANASDSDGGVSKVEFYANGSLIGADPSAPYSLDWSGMAAGTYEVSAKAIDTRGGSRVSASATVMVRPKPAPVGVTRHYVYDEHQRLCKTIEPETGATVMGYDAAGNLIWSAAGLDLLDPTTCDRETAYASGRRVDRTYDARNRIRTLSFPEGPMLTTSPRFDAGLGNQVWEYTPDGKPASVTTYNGKDGTLPVVNTYAYNRRGLMTRETASQPGWYTWALEYHYDANANLAGLTYPGGEVVQFAPNALGQVRQVSSTYGQYATGVSYYPNGALKQFTYGNGIVHTMTQNARGLPERSRDAYGSVAVLDDSYDYDQNGNVAAITDGLPGNRGNRDMSYDPLDRLLSVQSPMFGPSPITYEYDALDNLKRVAGNGRDHTYVYDAANRLTNVTQTWGGSSVVGLGYDAQGNLENRNGQEYVFDHGNRLRTVPGQEAYRYDAHGRRVLAWSPTEGNILSMYGQDGVLRYQRDLRASKVSNHMYLAGSLIATRETAIATGANTIKYQHTDALGSPVAVTDASRTVVQRSEYDPFGALLNRPISNGPGYTGHVMDAATGLTYMQQRYYDPSIGRFLSVDPIAADGNTGAKFNRYAYALNNPYKFVDPDGRDEEAWAQLGETISVELAKYRYRNTNDPQLKARIGSHLALVHRVKYGDTRTAQRYQLEVDQLNGAPAGIIYRRIDPKTGDTYIGQAISPERFAARQSEHDRGLGVQHDYEVIARAEPGQDLNVAEETAIRQHGGLRRDGGGLVNRRVQMREERYRAAGGREPPPTGTRIRRR